jgi:beta-xylosidase
MDAICKVALLLPATWHLGDKRSRWLETTPLRRIWCLTPRPSMPPGAVILAGETPGGGTQDFAWYVWLRGYDGIDPSLFFDDDGKVYLTSTGSAPGIHQTQLDVATGKLLTSPPKIVWKGTGGRYPEGPHLYKIAGRYYLMISEGGTEYGHMVTIARASCRGGRSSRARATDPHPPRHSAQPADQGRAPTSIQDAEGNWWMVFLAFRPQGLFWQHRARDLLAPVRWDAGLAGGQRQAIARHARTRAAARPTPAVRDAQRALSARPGTSAQPGARQLFDEERSGG